LFTSFDVRGHDHFRFRPGLSFINTLRPVFHYTKKSSSSNLNLNLPQDLFIAVIRCISSRGMPQKIWDGLLIIEK